MSAFIDGYCEETHNVNVLVYRCLASHTLFSVVMSHNRFFAITQFLHFANNSMCTGDDRLFKIRPIMEHFMIHFQKAFTPSQYVACCCGRVALAGNSTYPRNVPGLESKHVSCVTV